MAHNRQPNDWAEALALTPDHHAKSMSSVDTAWLRMDSATNLMMIVGVWTLNRGITRRALCERLQSTLLLYPRFLQRAQDGPNGVVWQHDCDFSLDDHVVKEVLPRVGKTHHDAALQKRVAQLTVLPLDRRRPLWQFHLVENYRGGSALIVRIHHCIADGVALIAVMQSLVDGGQLPPRRRERTHGHRILDRAELFLESWVLSPLNRVNAMAQDAAKEGTKVSLAFVQSPRQALETSLRRVWASSKWVMHGVNDVAAMALMKDDDTTRLKGTPSGVKHVAWCQPLSLARVKAVSKAMECSVNDVLLGCVAGAIGSYLASHGDKVECVEIRAMVSVNLRPMDQAYRLGNQFGLAPLLLPIGIENPSMRVYEVRRRMSELKGSMQPLLAFGLLMMAGFLPKQAQEALLALFSRKTTAVMTNVIGPKEKMHFLGSEISQSLFWVPQSGTVGLGVSILSYGGEVQFGLISDEAFCPNPQGIIDRFIPEFERLASHYIKGSRRRAGAQTNP